MDKELEEKDFNFSLDADDFQDSQINAHFSIVDISFQQRNNKKGWTVISNLPGDKDKIKNFIQKAKKVLSCNGTVDENNNIRFNGEHKLDLANLIYKEFNLSKDQVRVF